MNAPRIRVLVVDDSAVMRRVLSDVIAVASDFEVVGTASGGRLALSKLELLSPDVVTLDVEMPEMDGIETLRELKKRRPRLPVLMCSSLTVRGAGVTLDALTQGAADYVTKPTASTPGDREAFAASLLSKLRAIARRPALAGAIAATKPAALSVRFNGHPPEQPLAAAAPRIARPAAEGPVRVVVLGVSTGGPNALAVLIPELPADLQVPLLIVQHMPPLFTRLLAERLARVAPFPVTEAVDGEPLLNGHCYIAAGDHHLAVSALPGDPRLLLGSGPPENSCRPAVDVLFRTAAERYRSGTMAVVLTGMGQDGLRGCERVRALGGYVLVQDEATSVVWGMPGFVVQAGLADEVLPLEGIAGAIARRLPGTWDGGDKLRPATNKGTEERSW